MRPTVAEQLQGTCRILEDVVAPSVSEPFARTILDGLVANLKMLSGALPAVPGFLRDDNEATLRQLSGLRDVLQPSLAERIDQAAATSEPDVADVSALEERNRQLRELLSAAVCSEGLTADMQAAIERHMIQRASRVPMRYVSTAPSSADTKTPRS